MQRLSDYYQDKDVTIWVCPHGYPQDIVEFPMGADEPNAKVCGTHGEPFHKRCPNQDCTDPTYHPNDFEQRFHRPCGARIPWADTRRAATEVDYEPFNSKYVGRVARPLKEEPVQYFLPTESPTVTKELTPQERQDLISPPSGRLPAKSVRTPEEKENEPPRITGTLGTGSHLSDPDVVPKRRDMSKFIDWEGMNALRELDKNRAKLTATPKPSRSRRTTPTWGGFWSRIGEFLFGSMQNTFGTVVGAVIIVLIAAVCGVKLVVQ